MQKHMLISVRKKAGKKILKTHLLIFNAFLSGKEKTVSAWKEIYFNNPVLKHAAMLIVWSQGNSTFTMDSEGFIDSHEKSYVLNDATVKIAHPLEIVTALLKCPVSDLV